MSDGSTFQIQVDSSKGRSDLRSFSQEVDRVGNSLSKLASAGGGFAALGAQIAAASSGFEKLKSVAGIGNVAKEIGALSKSLSGLSINSRATAGLTQLAQSLGQLSRVNLPRGLGQNLESLTRGLANFRVPEMKDIARLPAMFKQLEALSNTKINPQTGASIQYLANGMRAIGSLPANNLARLPATFAALNRLVIDPDKAKSLLGIGEGLKGLSSFRAPSSASVANLGRFITTLEAADPGKLTRVATALHSVTLPAMSIRSQSGSGGGSSNPLTPPAPRLPTNTVASASSFTNASSGLHQLQQSFSAVHAAAAAFAGYLGGLSLRSFVSETLAAGNAITSFKLTLESVATHAGEVGQHFDFVKQLAKDTGGSLATMIPAFQQFDAALQASGMSAQTAQTTFSGFQKAFSVMHIGMADQKRAMKELTEVFGAEAGHARQVQIGLSSHLPQIMSDLGKVANKTSKEIHEMFKDGGIPPDLFIKLGEYYNKTFDVQLPEALRHSQAQLNAFGNAWFLFQEKVFSSGFDTGLSTMLQRLTAAFDTPKFSGLAEKIGSSFQSVFTALGSAGAVAANHAEGFTKLALAVGLATTASIGLQVVGLIVAPLTAAAGAAVRLGAALLTLSTPFAIPLLAGAAALAVVIASSDSADDAFAKLAKTWDFVKTSFTDFAASAAPMVSATFNGMASDGERLVDVLMNIGAYGKAAMTWGRRGETRTVGEIAAAYKAEDAAKLAAVGKPAGGDEIAPPKTDTFDKKITDLTKKLGGLVGSVGSDLLKEWRSEQEKTAAALAKTSTEVQHQGDYAGNAATALERQRRAATELKDAQSKLLDRLEGSNAALVELRKNIETIESMKGRKDGLGNVIDQSRIDALTKQAKLNALPSINPAAESIRKLTEEVSIKNQFAGDKDSLSDEVKVLELRNAQLKAGISLTKSQEDAYRALLKASRDLEAGGSNGFQQWASNVKSDAQMMNDTIKSSMDDISSKISDLAVNGKGKFKDLGSAIRATFASILGDISKKLIKNGIDSLLRDGIKSMSGMFGGADSGIAKALGLGKSATADALSGLADKSITAATATVNAGSVIVNGGAGSIGTSGVNAFGTSGANGGSALGGISPQNLPAAINPPVGNIGSGPSTFAGQPPILSSNPGASVSSALPSLSMALGKPGEALASIGRNSISAFGSGIAPAASSSTGVVTMALGRDGQPLGTIQPGAFFGRTPLQPIAPPSTHIGTLGNGSSINAFDGQSSASIISARGAEDNMARAGLGHLDFGKSGLAGREAYAWDFFKSRGYSDANTAKIMGNLKQEGGFNPRALNPNDGGPGVDSVGIAQWNNGRNNDLVGGRRALMERHAGGLYGKPYNQLTDREAYHGQLSNIDRELHTPQYRRALDRPDAASMGKLYEGYGDASGPTRNGYADGYLRRFGGRQANPSIDTNSTGSIAKQSQSMSQEFKQVGSELQKSLTQSVKGATPEVTQDLQKAFKGGSSGAEGELGGFASKITETGSAAQSAEGGLSGLISKLGSLGGGGGGLFGGGGEMLAGLFSEGGYSESPVSTASIPTSFWQGVPAFAEGTPNTSGGMLSVLHPGEAVIPLSRNRSIPVELRGDERGGGNTTVHNHMSMNLQTKDHDSFRRNAHQTAVALQNMLGRAAARSS